MDSSVVLYALSSCSVRRCKLSRMVRALLCAVILIVGTFLFPVSAAADTFEVTGIISDPTGHPIAGATVELVRSNECDKGLSIGAIDGIARREGRGKQDAGKKASTATQVERSTPNPFPETDAQQTGKQSTNHDETVGGCESSNIGASLCLLLDILRPSPNMISYSVVCGFWGAGQQRPQYKPGYSSYFHP